MTRANWRVLAAGPANQTLLTVDFGPGRVEANFADLVANLAPDTRVWQTVFAPANRDPAVQTDPERCVARWLDDVRDSELVVHGVFGYCAGAALAWRAADLFNRAGCGEPAVVLFDPSAVDGDLVYELFQSSVQTYAELLPEEQCQAALGAVAQVTSGLGADIADLSPPVLAAAMGAVQREYDALVRTVCELLDAGAEVGREFSDRFASFLSYLFTAGRALGYTSELVSPVVYASRNHPVPHVFGPASHRFPISRVGLLADPTVAAAVAEALSGARRGQPSPNRSS